MVLDCIHLPTNKTDFNTYILSLKPITVISCFPASINPILKQYGNLVLLLKKIGASYQMSTKKQTMLDWIV